MSEKGKAIFFPEKGIVMQSLEAKGKEINATAGIALEEDGTPMRLKSIAKKIKLDPTQIFPYESSFGNKQLREKWKHLIYEKNPSLKAETSLPIVTAGLTHGLNIINQLFVDKEDKVIIPDLFWENYSLIFNSNKLNVFRFFKENKFDVNCIRNKLKDDPIGKKIILLNFPNNPAGYTPTEKEAEQIADVLKEGAEAGNKIVVIIDDAYFGLIYKNGILTESIFARLADLHENILAIKVDGPTKECYAWGLRVGFLTYSTKNATKELYLALESKTAGIVRATVSNTSNLSQSLVLNALNSENYSKEKQKKYKLLKKRYKEVKRILKEHKEYEEEFNALPFNSGYFMCIELKNKEAEEIRKILLERYSTGVISIENKLRIAFSAVKTKDILKLFNNIYKACKE